MRGHCRSRDVKNVIVAANDEIDEVKAKTVDSAGIESQNPFGSHV